MSALIKRDKKIELAQARLASAEILIALSYLHQQKICHRDVKAENVLIDSQGHILLSDFGLSTTITEGTQLFQVCGTLVYMAPGRSLSLLIIYSSKTNVMLLFSIEFQKCC